MIGRYYREIENIHVNTEKPRAYFIPFDSDSEFSEKRENSGRFTLLNGEWDFKYYENIEEIDLEDKKFPDEILCGDKMKVPFCWQLKYNKGYDVPLYSNSDYPYPVDPPFLPDEIPCALYKRTFGLSKKENRRYFINFEGVSAGFYLWINGKFIGYSQVSHSTSEFEITENIYGEENTICVLAVKYTTGSYMEDQDFFRLSGIFRDVYILERDKDHIEDVYLKTDVSADSGKAFLCPEIKKPDNLNVKTVLKDSDGNVLYEGVYNDKMKITVDNAKLWSAETPYLYLFVLTAGEEKIYFHVGFKKLEIKGNILYLNGQKIKIFGMNRHEFSPETGYYVSPEEMYNDLRILKRANVNAIRTSHYPDDPRFYDMCDSLGVMLIDEADLETHGMGRNYGDWRWDYWAHICDVPEWADACVDRAERLFERDKNRVSVIFWSLGNESGCGENHRKMANYIRSRKPDAIIHYENAHLEYSEKVGRDFSDISDVESRMYAPLDYLKKYLENKDDNPKFNKPFFYCEYASAWSVCDVRLHWEEFEKYDNYAGGCFWEYCDHALNVGTKESPKFRYGGDFGDFPNNGVYCADGVVSPDRKLYPGYFEIKETYKPFDAKFAKGKLTVRNRRYFTSLSDLEFDWKLVKNGDEILADGKINSPVPPRGEKSFVIFGEDEFLNEDGFISLDISAVKTNSEPWCEKGYEVGRKQFIIKNSPVIPKSESSSDSLKLCEDMTKIYIVSGKVKFAVSKISGKIMSIYDGSEITKGAIDFSVFRSYHVSNQFASSWENAFFEYAKTKNYYTRILKVSDDEIKIMSSMSISAVSLPPAVKFDVLYTFKKGGEVEIKVNAAADLKAPCLPRFGIELPIDASFDNIEYLGYGPQDSYADKYRLSVLSKYRTTVDKNFVRYVKPYECSGHYAVKYAMLTDENGRGIAISDESEKGFQFNAKYYSDSQMLHAKHDDDLKKGDAIFVNVDYKMQADNTIDGKKEPEREFSEKKFMFSYILKII